LLPGFLLSVYCCHDSFSEEGAHSDQFIVHI
jgi:hypothetical protein